MTDTIDALTASAAETASAPALADPTPLAFGAVGLPFGIICLSLTGKFTPDLSTVTLPLALVYGTIGLFVAGMIAFRSGDVFGAFTYTSFSAFFGSFGMIQVFLAWHVTAIKANGLGSASAFFVGGWAIIITYLLALIFQYPPLFRMIFGLVWLTLILLTIGFAGSATLLTWGAWLGAATAALCLYASAAVLANTTLGRTVLPI